MRVTLLFCLVVGVSVKRNHLQHWDLLCENHFCFNCSILKCWELSLSLSKLPFLTRPSLFSISPWRLFVLSDSSDREGCISFPQCLTCRCSSWWGLADKGQLLVALKWPNCPDQSVNCARINWKNPRLISVFSHSWSYILMSWWESIIISSR